MNRLLLLCTDLQIGGTPTVVRELAIRLRRRGIDAEVACLAGWGPVAQQLRAASVPVWTLDAAGLWDVLVAQRLNSLVRDRGIDTVFSFLLHANAVAAAASLVQNAAGFLTGEAAGLRLIQSIQTTQPYPAWHWLAQRFAHHAAQVIVVPSPSASRAAQEWAGVPAGKIVVIPNAVDPADFAAVRPIRADVRPVPIGFLGRLDPVKGIPDLLEAVRLLGEQVTLHIFGDGPQRSQIESLIAGLVISHRVTLHGAVEDPREALAQMAMLVLPSKAEGFGLVLIEAMAAGVSVVATEVAGIRDVVLDGQTGLLVPPGRPGELATAIQRLIHDDSLRQAMVRRAREDVAKRFSWDVVLPKYIALMAG